MENENIKQTPESIMQFITHFQKSRVILTAFELDIFSALDQHPKTSQEVAELKGTDPRATDRLMNAVCSLGFLRKEDTKFLNTEETSEFFVKGKPGYMAGLHHTLNLWHTWSTLTESVRQGTATFQRPADINDRDSQWLESFIGAMHYRARKQAPALVDQVDLEGVKRVLDVGGGSGAFAMAFIKPTNDITATVFDLPNVIPLTEKYIRQENMTTKVDTVSGDFTVDPLPGGYDLVLLSAIVHAYSYLDNIKLIRKCAGALTPGGQILIQDFVMEEDRVNPPGGAMFALNMLVGTEAGDTFTLKEMQEWFDYAGIRFVKRLDSFMGTSLVIGRKAH